MTIKLYLRILLLDLNILNKRDFMNVPILFTIIMYISTFLLIWYFVIYPVLMSIFALKLGNSPHDLFYPQVSIIIPTYNEEKVIENRINNIMDLNYPKEKYEIIIVDSGSTDNTVKIVENMGLNSHLTMVMEQNRNGKASAINFGKKYANYDIVLVTDANAIFDKDVLKNMMPHFKDPKVGAVGGRYCVSNPDNSITQSESFYWDLEVIMRIGESIIDSASLFHGEINAWRKDIVEADITALSEDLDMCIQIRKKGYKIQYEPKSVVFEPSATTVDDQIKQRKRTSIGTIQTIFKHWKFFMFPKNLYSLFIVHSHKTLAMLSPFLIITILISYIMIWNINIILIQLVSSIILFSIFLVVLLYLKSKIMGEINQYTNQGKISITMIPKIVKYVLLNEYLILMAWKSYLLKDYSVLWEKVESSRLN